YNRPRVEAEAFTGVSLWQYGPGDYKTTADKAMCEGLTSFVYHTSPHIPREAGKPGWVYNFGTLMNTTRTWWDLSDGFHNYLGRSCFMLQQGNFVGDVLFYYGDKAPNFVKNKAYNESLGFGYDYDYTNSDIILNKLDVKDGRFVLPHGQSYSVIVLPNEEEINPEVLAKLKSLVNKGGILVGDKPLRSYSLQDYKANNKKVEKLANEMWKDGSDKIAFGKGTIYSKNQTLKNVLADLNIQPDVQVNKENPQDYIDYIHRVTDDADIYFVRNTSGVKQTLELKLRSSKTSVEVWNPDDASTSKLPFYNVENGVTALPLTLDALESTFIVIRNGKKENNIVEVKKDGKVLFPDTKVDFPLVVNKNDIVFEAEGKFEFTYSDGTVKTFDNDKAENEKLITGQWQLRFPFGWGAPQRMNIDQLKSWTEFKDEGVKHFSGQATYLKKIELTEEEVSSSNKVILDLGKVSKVAKVYINGHELASMWFAPYTIDITEFAKKGDNYLRIEVANMFNNQLVGDGLRKEREKRTHSNVVQGPNPWGDRWEDLELLESGLIGPVKVKFEKTFN
ncbi:MAG: hypothetical protein KAG37_09060, partial [Flavobacteriales bacterium]|nr:hypothetical protein [Flavobacteriales bacterium]